MRVGGGYAGLAITCRENKGAAALIQEIGDGIDLLQPEIHVEKRAVDRFPVYKIERIADSRDRAGHDKSKLVKEVFEGERNKRFVLDDEDAQLIRGGAGFHEPYARVMSILEIIALHARQSLVHV